MFLLAIQADNRITFVVVLRLGTRHCVSVSSELLTVVLWTSHLSIAWLYSIHWIVKYLSAVSSIWFQVYQLRWLLCCILSSRCGFINLSMLLLQNTDSPIKKQCRTEALQASIFLLSVLVTSMINILSTILTVFLYSCFCLCYGILGPTYGFYCDWKICRDKPAKGKVFCLERVDCSSYRLI